MDLLVCRRGLDEIGLCERSLQRRLSSGKWSRVLPGVYLTDPDQRSFTVLAEAASIWAPDGVVSFSAAARLHGLPKVQTGVVEITLPSRRRSPVPWLVTHHATLEWFDVMHIGVIPVTGCCRTIIDLAGTDIDPQRLEELFDDCLRLNLANLRQFAWRLALLPKGTRGIRLLRDFVERRTRGIPASELEEVLRGALRRFDMPVGEFGYEVTDEEGTMFIDMAYPPSMVAVECDSFLQHSTPDQVTSDCARRNRLTLLGWNVLHFTWEQLTKEAGKSCGSIRRALESASTLRKHDSTGTYRQPRSGPSTGLGPFGV